MKGTIDRIEAFTSSITGVWGRGLAFFGVCWAAFAITYLTLGTTWSFDGGFSFQTDTDNWYLVPMAWGASLVIAVFMFLPWGLAHMIYLFCVLHSIFTDNTDLFRTLAILFVAECIYVIVLWLRHSYEDLFDFDFVHGTWHPLLSMQVLFLGYVVIYVMNQRRKEREGVIFTDDE
jgi:hypothetical protein